MTNTLYATKKYMRQTWTKSGKRLPATVVELSPHIITQLKTKDKDGYTSLQVAFGTQKPKRINKPTSKHLKKSKLDSARFIKEIPLAEPDTELSLGQKLQASDVFSVGDIVQVSGTSKGKGFSGVMKRWGFAGGPRTHGQSDRERAPGAIGQGTYPGRVWKGKKMAGQFGNATITTTNLQVINLDETTNTIWIKGSLPGSFGNLVKITKTGESQFEGLREIDQFKPEAQVQTSEVDSATDTNQDESDKTIKKADTPTDRPEDKSKTTENKPAGKPADSEKK